MDLETNETPLAKVLNSGVIIGGRLNLDISSTYLSEMQQAAKISVYW